VPHTNKVTLSPPETTQCSLGLLRADKAVTGLCIARFGQVALIDDVSDDVDQLAAAMLAAATAKLLLKLQRQMLSSAQTTMADI